MIQYFFIYFEHNITEIWWDVSKGVLNKTVFHAPRPPKDLRLCLRR